MMGGNALKVIFILLCSVLTFSCNRNKSIILDASDEASLSPDVQWAVVYVPYVALREYHDEKSDVTSHAKQGTVLKIEGIFFAQQKDSTGHLNKVTWYKFEDGWLEGTAIKIYDNRLKAETASARLAE